VTLAADSHLEKKNLDMVDSCLATYKAEIGRSHFKASPGKKVHKTNSWMQWYMPVISATWEAQFRSSQFQVSQSKKQDLISKNNQSKRAGGSRAVESLSSKLEALSSNPSPPKKKKFRMKKRKPSK
jgi:hypothetical protein